MRKIGKKEARLVEEFNVNKEHQAELQRQLRVLEKLEEIKRNFEGTATARLREKELLKLRGLDR